jgi:hypothetical protein
LVLGQITVKVFAMVGTGNERIGREWHSCIISNLKRSGGPWEL